MLKLGTYNLKNLGHVRYSKGNFILGQVNIQYPVIPKVRNTFSTLCDHFGIHTCKGGQGFSILLSIFSKQVRIYKDKLARTIYHNAERSFRLKAIRILVRLHTKDQKNEPNHCTETFFSKATSFPIKGFLNSGSLLTLIWS